MGFTGLDYAVLFSYLFATAAFGAWLGRGQKNLRDYFLAGRSLPWWAICFSIVATETSTLTFIGAPAIAYEGNLTFLQVAFGYVVGRLLVSKILIPSYFRGDIQSAYEILTFRFGGKVRNFSALLFQINRALADGVRLFATALVLSVVTQMTDIWTVVIIGVITIAYTFYGGMTAVVWNDAIQLVIYLGGALLAGYLLLERIPGGWSEVVSAASFSHKFQIFDFSFSWSNPYTFSAGLLGGAFLTFATHGTDQMMVQRYLACGSKRGSQAALVVSGLVVVLQFLLFLLIGVMLFAFYQHFPLHQEIRQTNRIFPIFIVREMPAGISGLIIAAIFAAAMSTLSSSLNSLASSSVNDFYKSYLKPHASDGHYLAISRLFTLAWGVILVAVSVLARNWGEVLQVGLTITSVTMGSILGIFLLGQWTRRTSEAGALTAMATSLLVMIGIHLSGAIAWPWYVLIGTVLTLAVGLLQPLLGTGRR
ncbi:MAG: sodium:solute symporter [Acidobacteriota bacterium]